MRWASAAVPVARPALRSFVDALACEGGGHGPTEVQQGPLLSDSSSGAHQLCITYDACVQDSRGRIAVVHSTWRSLTPTSHVDGRLGVVESVPPGQSRPAGLEGVDAGLFHVDGRLRLGKRNVNHVALMNGKRRSMWDVSTSIAAYAWKRL